MLGPFVAAAKLISSGERELCDAISLSCRRGNGGRGDTRDWILICKKFSDEQNSMYVFCGERRRACR